MTTNKQKKLTIHILLDASGSMNSIREDALGGVNAYVQQLHKDKSKGKVSVTMFNSCETTTPREHIKIKEWQDIPARDYRLNGMTPLLDAIGAAVADLDKQVKDKDRAAVLVISTDGLENDSKEHTKDSIRKLLEDRQEQGWLITYLGADHDAFDQAGSLGLKSKDVIQSKKSKMGETMTAYAANTRAYAATGMAIDAAWTDEQREQAKD